MKPQTNEKPSRPTVKALLARIGRLEAYLDARLDIERGLRDEQAARHVQSIGVVLDYLASKGLLDREELKRHVEGKFPIMQLNGPNGVPQPMLDLYGWLIWVETRNRRLPQAR